MTRFPEVWAAPEADLAAGRIPGYVGAVRIRGEVEVRAAGRTALGDEAPPMTPETLFRIASLTKPIGGALVLSLVADGVLRLDDPIARWLPEAAAPRVLVDAEGPLDATAPAREPITLRHLLTCTAGWGAVFAATPLQRAMFERGVYPGALPPDLTPEEWTAALLAAAGVPAR